MGTRTAPRKKTKQIQRKKRQAARHLSQSKPQSKIEERVESATFSEEIHKQNRPAASPADTAAAWARENEANSTIKQVATAALICGQKISQTASALGVDRRTLQRWQKLDPEFQLALVETRQEVVLSSRQYLLALAEEAAGVVETKLSEEQNAQVALSLLRGMGVLAPQSVEAKLRNEVKSAKEFCAQTATLGETESDGTRAKNEFCAQTATLDATESQTDDGCHAPRLRGHDPTSTANEFRAQTATFGNASREAKVKANETEIPAQEEAVPPSLSELPIAQQRAIEAIYAGKSLAEVAPIAGTSESTLRSWICGDRPFFEALSGLQFDRLYHLKYRLLTLVKQAMQIIRTALSEGNGRVALSLLRGFGVMQ